MGNLQELALGLCFWVHNYNDSIGCLDVEESGVMEEAQLLSLQAAKSAPDALTALTELSKKIELGMFSHSLIDYISFQKNLYRVPHVLAALTNESLHSRPTISPPPSQANHAARFAALAPTHWAGSEAEV